MTIKEFGKLAAAIKTYYPKENMLPSNEAMELWYDALKDLDYKYAEQGLRKYVMSNKFPPSIADIRECSLDFERPQELNEMEAWSLVSKALRNGYYGAEEEFAKLPPIVQKAVGQPSQLRTWATDEEYDEAVVSSNFMRSYRVELARAQQISKLPYGMQTAIGKVNENRGIEVKPYVSIEEKIVEPDGVQMSDEQRERYDKLKAEWASIPMWLSKIAKKRH